MKLHFTNDWLRAKISSDPDVEVEAGEPLEGREVMTKHVRIENADMSDYKVEVEVWEKATVAVAGDRVYGVDGPDKLVETLELSHPTSMVNPYITSTRYLVIKEKS